MKIAFLIYLLMIGFWSKAQPIAKGVAGYLEVDHGNGYEKSEERFDQSVLKLTISNKARKIIAAEYTRWNDSAFVYKGYDSSGKLITAGVLALNPQKEVFFTIQKPDLINDPTLELGLMISKLVFGEKLKFNHVTLLFHELIRLLFMKMVKL